MVMIIKNSIQLMIGGYILYINIINREKSVRRVNGCRYILVI